MLNERNIKDADTIVLVVTGGIGRNIMATAVVRNIKKTFPDKTLHVLAGCPDIFLRNPYVKRVHRLGGATCFYDDFIVDRKTIVVDVEPYRHFDYVYQKKHFVQCWCEMLNIPCDNIYPDLFFNSQEERMAELFISKFDKPVILLQHSGGRNPDNPNEKDRIIASSGMYRRSLPEQVTQEVTDYYVSKGFVVGSLQTQNQFCPERSEKIQFPIRAICALIPKVKGIIAIDSFLQHAVAYFKRKSLVVWGGTSPKVLGYDCNVNLTREACQTPMCHRPNSYLFDFDSTGFIWNCPESDACMQYDPKKIINEFNNIIGLETKDDSIDTVGSDTESPDASNEHSLHTDSKGCTCGEEKCSQESPCGAR